MKNIINLSILALSLALFSCEEVIDIELNDSNTQWVIEGQIHDDDQEAQVRISQTGSYFSPGEYTPGTGASVRISSTDGSSYTLEEETPGTYRVSNVNLNISDQYRLSVDFEGTQYEATSILHPPLQMDSLTAEFQPGVFGFEDGYFLRVNFQDPPGIRNYVRFEIEVNGEPRSDIALYDDNLTDGNRIAFPLFVDPFQLGDRVRVIAYSLDFEVYKYWTGLSEILGQGNGGGEAAAPANPPSNISPDVLGYFGVSAVSEVEIELE